MATASSAIRVCTALRSASENTATVRRSSSRQARITRQAISPRLAMSTFLIRRAGTSVLLVSRRTAGTAWLGACLDPLIGAHEDVDRADVGKFADLVTAPLQALQHVAGNLRLDGQRVRDPLVVDAGRGHRRLGVQLPV